MKTALIAGGALLLGLLILMGVHLGQVSGSFAPQEATAPGACTVIAELPGAEDITRVPGLGLITGAGGIKETAGVRAGLYLLTEDGPVLLTGDMPADFRPHGLSVWTGGDEVLVYAVSHPDDGHSVEVFAVREGGLVPLRSLRDPLITQPNDLAVIGEDRFFVTNWVRFEEGPLGALEGIAGLPVTNLVFYDAGEARIADKGLRMANGLILRGETLWLAETFGRQLREYDLDRETGALTPRGTVDVHTMPDNITLARDGTLLIGGIHDALAFQAHAEGKAETTSAQVRRFDPETGNVTTAFYTENSEIGGVTVGFDDGARLLMGTAFGDGVLACAMP